MDRRGHQGIKKKKKKKKGWLPRLDIGQVRIAIESLEKFLSSICRKV